MVPFGSPVVPEVKPIRQTSSAAVSTAVEVRRGLRHQRLEAVGPARSPIHHVLQIGRHRPGALHLVREAMVAERDGDLRLLQRIGDLLGAQQRHGGDDDAAGLQHRQIGRHHHRVVGRAQQHPVARHEAELVDQHVADAVHALLQRAVGQRLGRADEAGLVAPALVDPPVEKGRGAVQPLGILELGAGEQEGRP